MGNTQTNLVQGFAAAPLELRHGEWFSRWWRDPSEENCRDRQRQLRTFAFGLDHTETQGRLNQLGLLIQESSFCGFWKIYRIVIAPYGQGDACTGPRQVIVLMSCIINFQVAINLLICLARVGFYAKENLQRYFSEPNVNAQYEFVRPIGAWPPRTDRITDDTQIYSNTKFKRLSTAYVAESDLEADIVLCHGLGGDLMRTWTCPSDTAGFGGVDKPWPANQLLDGSHSIYQSGLSLPPRQNIRVITIGHTLSLLPTNDGSVTDSIEATTQRIWANMRESRVGKRPMVWLGHSLGCLLLKEVLLFDSYQPSQCRLGLEENLKGVIFYGGPHNGSVFAGALTDFTINVSFILDSLRFRLQIGSSATTYLSTVSSDNRNRHALLNKFFFDDLSVPFINFRESIGVRLRPGATIQIVKNEESDVNDGGIRTVQSGFVPTNVSVDGFRNIRTQLLVEHHHLDICAPEWLGEEPPSLYKVSRDAIAAWLCQPQPSPIVSPEPTEHHDDLVLFSQLLLEVLALLYAVVSLGRPQITSNEGLVFRCAWSNLLVSHSVIDHLKPDKLTKRVTESVPAESGVVDDLKPGMLVHGKRETESVPTDLEAELQRISSSLSTHRQGWADLSDMAFRAASTAVVTPAVTAEAASLTVASFETAVATLVLNSLLGPVAVSVALISLVLNILRHRASDNATNLLTNPERELATKRPDVIQLVDAMRPQLTSVFEELRADRSELMPEIKYTVLRRCRDIIFTQMCAEHVPTGNEDILAQAIARLDSEDGRMRKIINECQMYRANARRKAGLPI